jgi:uncharacterized protein YbjQ (UPF0145 family)
VPLLRRRHPPTTEQESRRLRTEAAIAKNRLPPEVVQRLARVRGGDGAFTSNLSTAEFAALRTVGYRPVTQVMGATAQSIPYQAFPSPSRYATSARGWLEQGAVRELSVLTKGWNETRRTALRRLREEAQRAGADVVVGVRFSAHRRAPDTLNVLELVVTGTALAAPGARVGDEEPVLSHLSGQEFATLIAHGWAPLGLVASSTACYVVAGADTQRTQQGYLRSIQWRGAEFADYTRGVYEARSRVLERVRAEARALDAAGIIGVSYDQRIETVSRRDIGVRDLIVTLHLLGTAISARPSGARWRAGAVLDLASSS